MANQKRTFSGSETPSKKAFSKFTIRLDDVDLDKSSLEEVRNQAIKAALEQVKKAKGAAGAQDFGTFSTFSTFGSSG